MMARTVLSALVMLGAVPAHAQDGSAGQDIVVLEARTLDANSGRTSINIAAGDHNQQAAAALVAIGTFATGALSLDQTLTENNRGIAGPAEVVVGAGAVTDNSGLVSLNVSAGNGNQSANLTILNISQSGALSDLQLSQARAPSEPSGSISPSSADTEHSVSIANDAFSGNAGLVQINLTGGEANASANTFVLNVSAGGQQQP